MTANAADGRPRRLAVELACFAACVAAAIVFTWPLATVFGTRLCGDLGDPWQTLWGMRWMRDALGSLRNPFFTDRVYYPTGSTLVFQTFDLPSTIAVLPLWGRLPEVAIYNTAVVLAIALTAYGMFRLVRELTGDRLVGLAAGMIFAAVPYQFAHLQGHLHLLSMGWVPLFLVHAVRVLRGAATVRDGALGGLFLALGTLASWYHLLYAGVLLAVLVGYALVTRRLPLPSRRTVSAVLVLGATWLVLVGPLLGAMLVERARGPLTGAHDPSEFSADVYAFALPNAAQGWRGAFGKHFERWGGNSTEIAVYVGYTATALAVFGAWKAAAARPFLVAALVGAVLALGPALHVDGRVVDVELPYAFLERALPLLGLAGVPVRFGYVMYLGVTVAAAFGLAALRARVAARGRTATTLVVLAPVVLVLLEYSPRPLITSAYAVPPPMRAWAEDPTTFAVLDVWDSYRPMWHATIHRKPMVGGYLSRVPERVEAEHQLHPVVRCIVYGGDEAWLQRVDPAIDFDWRATGPAAMIAPEHFEADWWGTLVAPVDGTYALWLEADDAGVVIIDGALVVRRSGPCSNAAECVAHATVPLAAGRHGIRIEYRQLAGPARLRLWWQPPGGTRAIVPSEALRTDGGLSGLAVEYRQPVEARSGLGTEGGREALRTLGVRYVITRDQGNRCIEEDLRLPVSYEGEEVRIYEVPGAGGAHPSSRADG